MTGPFRSICVFCGAAPGRDPVYSNAATQLGREIASRGMTLVYGGGRAGMMGAVADGSLSAGGRVIGVIPGFMKDRELEHRGIAELRTVETMHERKMTMAGLADAFIALPGGLGTLDELFEILAWAQLAIHDKPVGLLNVAGYFDGLVTFLGHAAASGFVRMDLAREVRVSARAPDLLADLECMRGARKG